MEGSFALLGSLDNNSFGVASNFSMLISNHSLFLFFLNVFVYIYRLGWGWEWGDEEGMKRGKVENAPGAWLFTRYLKQRGIWVRRGSITHKNIELVMEITTFFNGNMEP